MGIRLKPICDTELSLKFEPKRKSPTRVRDSVLAIPK